MKRIFYDSQLCLNVTQIMLLPAQKVTRRSQVNHSSVKLYPLLMPEIAQPPMSTTHQESGTFYILTNCHNRSAQSFRDTKKKKKRENKWGDHFLSSPKNVRNYSIRPISSLETCQICLQENTIKPIKNSQNILKYLPNHYLTSTIINSWPILFSPTYIYIYMYLLTHIHPHLFYVEANL